MRCFTSAKFPSTRLWLTRTGIAKDHDLVPTSITALSTITGFLPVNNWLKANKLTLNIDKSAFLLFHPPQKSVTKPVLKLNGELLAEKSQVKYLGVTIDEHLSWKSHVNHVNMKLARALGILKKLKDFAPKNLLRTFFYSFFQPHIDYCLINWGSAPSTTLEPIRTKLNKAIRLISSLLRTPQLIQFSEGLRF